MLVLGFVSGFLIAVPFAVYYATHVITGVC